MCGKFWGYLGTCGKFWGLSRDTLEFLGVYCIQALVDVYKASYGLRIVSRGVWKVLGVFSSTKASWFKVQSSRNVLVYLRVSGNLWI